MRSELHTVDAAMARGELSEDEAYFVLRFAGRFGYATAIKRLAGKPFRRLRRWFAWFGGWEHPELSQWDRGKPAWEFRRKGFDGKTRWNPPFPVSFFGHRVTLYGRWGQIKWGRGYLVASSDYAYKWPRRVYWSPDGTPQNPKAKFYVGTRRAA